MISLKVLLFFLFQVGCGLGETFEKIRPSGARIVLPHSCLDKYNYTIRKQFNPTWNDNFIYAVDVCFYMKYPYYLFTCKSYKDTSELSTSLEEKQTTVSPKDTSDLSTSLDEKQTTVSWIKTWPAKIILTLRLVKDEKNFINLSVDKTIQSTETCAHFDISTISKALEENSIPRDKTILYGAVTFPTGVVTKVDDKKRTENNEKEEFRIELRGTGSFLASEHDFKKRMGEFPYTTIYNFTGSDGKGLEPIFNQISKKETCHTTMDGRDIKIETFRDPTVLPVKEDNTLKIQNKTCSSLCATFFQYPYEPEELEKDIVKDDINTKDSIPKDSIPKDSIPKDSIPKDSIPKDSIPKDSIPKDSIPKDSIPKDSIPEGSTTGHTTKSVSNFSSIVMILTLMTLAGL